MLWRHRRVHRVPIPCRVRTGRMAPALALPPQAARPPVAPRQARPLPHRARPAARLWAADTPLRRNLRAEGQGRS